MLRSYLTIAWRSIRRSKINSLITVAGLGVGIACCLLIALYVKEEWTFDQFHTKANRIYRVWAKEYWGENQEFIYSTTPYPMGPTLKENFEQVEAEVRINPVTSLLRVNDEQFTDQVTVVGKDFFKVFDFDVLLTSSKVPLGKATEIVITEKIARKYFGDDNPIDKTISIQLSQEFDDFVVSAVVQDPPTNSSIQFDMLISDENLKKFVSERALTSAWFNITPETYVMLSQEANADDLTAKFPALFKTLLGDDFEKSKYTVMLQPLTDIHLNTTVPVGFAPVSNPKYSYILIGTAVLILLLACINFVTISIGRSLKRSREVGIRKVVGAVKRQIVAQFVGEAVLITLLSMVLGLILAFVFLPLFNGLAQKQLSLDMNGFLALISLIILVIVGVLSGSYPAFVLANLKVHSIFKGGTVGGTGKHTLRRALVAVQITLAVLLVTSTLIMRNQLSFLQNKDLGFDREQLAVVQLNVNSGRGLAERVKNGFDQAELFKNELKMIPSIAGVCVSSHDFANGNWVNIGYTDDTDVYRTFNMNIIDPDYFNVLKIDKKFGRLFDKNSNADATTSIIVNEAFVKEMGWEEPIGKRIPGKNFPAHEVIGVVSDFNYSSLYTTVEPLVLVRDPSIIFPGIENINMGNSPIPKLLIRIQAGQISETMPKVENVWNKLTDGEEFTFSFVDQALNAQYARDQNLGEIIGVSTLLAIMLGSLGLYGLASLSMQSKVKEISIRKVFGASSASLLVRLTREYILLVLISLIISIPFTIYLMNDWLSTFEYRIDIRTWYFVAAGACTMAIALLTILYQTMVAANSKPAEMLRNE